MRKDQLKKIGSRASLLGVAVLIFVFLAIPNTTNAEQYVEDFDDGSHSFNISNYTFSICQNPTFTSPNALCNVGSGSLTSNYFLSGTTTKGVVSVYSYVAEDTCSSNYTNDKGYSGIGIDYFNAYIRLTCAGEAYPNNQGGNPLKVGVGWHKISIEWDGLTAKSILNGVVVNQFTLSDYVSHIELYRGDRTDGALDNFKLFTDDDVPVAEIVNPFDSWETNPYIDNQLSYFNNFNILGTATATAQISYYVDESDVSDNSPLTNVTAVTFILQERTELGSYDSTERVYTVPISIGSAETIEAELGFLEDGHYKLHAMFVNFSCTPTVGRNDCPLSGIQGIKQFSIVNGVLDEENTELYDNLTRDRTAPDCAWNKPIGCIQYVFFILFNPSNHSLDQITQAKENLMQRKPFVYVGALEIVLRQTPSVASSSVPTISLALWEDQEVQIIEEDDYTTFIGSTIHNLFYTLATGAIYIGLAFALWNIRRSLFKE